MKLQYIDSIRGIAILMVILGHVGQEIRGLSFFPHLLISYGQMGVQLFFVASAYTLCLSAANRVNESNPIQKYAIRRLFRIAPVYYIGMFGYFLLAVYLEWNKSGLLNIPDQYTIMNILSNLFFFHGFYPSGNNSIVPGGWSIGTEMAFYVIFPILFYYSKKWTKGDFGKALLLLVSVFTFLQLILILIYKCTGILLQNNSFLYYNLINQISVFCLGIFYYLFQSSKAFKQIWKFNLISFLVLTSLSLLLWNSNIPNIFSAIPFLSALSFVFLINLFKNSIALNFNLLARIGTVSYSMYIIHFILLSFSADASLKLSDYYNKNFILIFMFCLTVTVTFYCAVISEKYIEKPFINLGKKIILKVYSN